ncbi:hypothetical protein K458DRAFT_402650 [Lentithecium fluviatile CBS 122367]|uniref:Uncharacterized protein n=1 Tax=Lentithecium fluviatile CBS 122367 TaxID=1168545 RepID=A0A6G1J7E5_9PLEO|nr:hypothetical protein K458DRAFT_402650 [Lentithecium fluviatile CBS 122367]
MDGQNKRDVVLSAPEKHFLAYELPAQARGCSPITEFNLPILYLSQRSPRSRTTCYIDVVIGAISCFTGELTLTGSSTFGVNVSDLLCVAKLLLLVTSDRADISIASRSRIKCFFDIPDTTKQSCRVEHRHKGCNRSRSGGWIFGSTSPGSSHSRCPHEKATEKE